MSKWEKIYEGVFYAIIVVIVLSILLMIGSSIVLGGDATNGYHKDGKYYVYNRDRFMQSQYIEVSRKAWYFNKHITMLVVGLAPVAVAMVFLGRGRIWQKQSPEEVELMLKTAETVKASGNVVICEKVSGNLGSEYDRAIYYQVHPGGILFKLKLPQKIFGISLDELVEVKVTKPFYKNKVKLVHLSKFVASPILLDTADCEKLVNLLTEQIAAQKELTTVDMK